MSARYVAISISYDDYFVIICDFKLQHFTLSAQILANFGQFTL